MRPAAALPLLLLIGWSLVAFAGLLPLDDGAVVRRRRGAARASNARRSAAAPARVLDWSLLACLAVVAAQLIPLSASARGRLSPQAVQIDQRAAPRRHAADACRRRHCRIDAESTAWALALGAAYVGLFWCARSIFARGGVRTVTRGITWLGLGLTVLVAVQRATSPSMLYWYFQPLDAGASPYGPFVSRNALATWLAMAVPLVIGYAVARASSRIGASSVGIAAQAEAMDSTQLWLAGAACLMIGGLFASMSRAGILGDRRRPAGVRRRVAQRGSTAGVPWSGQESGSAASRSSA